MKAFGNIFLIIGKILTEHLGYIRIQMYSYMVYIVYTSNTKCLVKFAHKQKKPFCLIKFNKQKVHSQQLCNKKATCVFLV